MLKPICSSTVANLRYHVSLWQYQKPNTLNESLTPPWNYPPMSELWDFCSLKHRTSHGCTCKHWTYDLVLSSCLFTWPKLVIHQSKIPWVRHIRTQHVLDIIRCIRCIRSLLYRRLAGSCVAGTCTGDRWQIVALQLRVQAFRTHQTVWTNSSWFGCSVGFCFVKKSLIVQNTRLWRGPKELWPAHLWRPTVP